MKLSERAQKLLERLWVATEEEAPPAGLTLNGATPEGIDELVQRGLAERNNGQLRLTLAGHPQAAQAVRRRRLAERLLADVLTQEELSGDEPGCRLEPALFDNLDESICTLLGHPRFCPHGKPIPRGKCCQQRREAVGRLIASLSELQPGQEGHIAYIQMNNPRRLQKLMAMGVLPGVPIRLLRRFPALVFEAGYSQFAVDEEIAADIYVRLTDG
jgi:DtxR family Mn-dependent transcriptional regulator